MTRLSILLILAFFAAYLIGEIALISRDAPTVMYVWRKFARLASAQEYWLNWLIMGAAFVALLVPLFHSLVRRIHAMRITNALLVFYFSALLFELIRLSVLWATGVEPGFELAVYAMARAKNLAADGARALLNIPIHVPLITVIFALFGYGLFRLTKIRIRAVSGEHSSEDQQIVSGLAWKKKVVIIILGFLGLGLGTNVTELRALMKLGMDAGVGTPTDIPKDLRVRTWPYEADYKRRYGYNLRKGTNVVIYMMESVRDEYMETTRSRYFRKTSEHRRIKGFYVPVPHSSNSHYSLLTGRYSSSRAMWRYGGVRPGATMPGVLGAAGYRSYYLTSGPAWYDGEDKMLRRLGMRIIQRKDLDRWKNPRTGRRYRRFGWGLNDIAMLDGLRRILRGERGPFFMLHVFTNTHTPYWNPYPGRYKRFNGKTKRGAHRNGIDWTMDLIDRMTDEYKKRGLFRNTIFILLSDHGESFGEHGFRMHDFSLYNTELRIPFIMRHPDLRRWDDIREFPAGSILDVFPTLMDMLGLPYPEPVHGRSLFAPDYRLRLFLRSWGSDAYAGYILGNAKWIHGLRRRELKRMNLDDGDVRILPLNPSTRRFVRDLRKIRF